MGDARQNFSLRTHPDGDLFVGDQVSFEVIVSGHLPGVEDHHIVIDLPSAASPPTLTVSAPIAGYGIGARQEAVFYWAWDTTGLAPAAYTLTLHLRPVVADSSKFTGEARQQTLPPQLDDLTWHETITLRPRSNLPPAQAQAQWAQTQTNCCVVHYITGTQAEHDLPQLKAMIDQQAAHAAQKMGIDLAEPLHVNLIPRVLGHGGFAAGDVSVTYVQDNYLAADPAMILHHEMIHVLDARLGGKYRPAALVEGLATYESGGHYQPTPLAPTAGALLPPYTNQYAPLKRLFDNFYFEQHEVGYLEAAALIEYLIRSGGQAQFEAFYRGMEPPPDGGAPSQAVEIALQQHYRIGLAELDQRFRHYLEDQLVTPEIAAGVALTVRFYELLRTYQQRHDPSAYFLSAWLLDRAEMEKRGITADYLRRPQAPINIEMEARFYAAAQAMLQKDYAQANRILDLVQTALPEQ